MKNKKKMILVAVVAILLIVSIVPTALAANYNGSCKWQFTTSGSVYHNGGLLFNHNAVNRIGSAQVSSQNWFDNTGSGSNSSSFVTDSGYSASATAAGGYYYKLVVKNFWQPGTSMYSSGSFSS